MRIARMLGSLVIVAASVLLMGQARNCSDFNQIIPELDKLFTSTQKGSKIYVANLSFLDVDTPTDAARFGIRLPGLA